MDLRGANLQGANLREVDLRGASLRGANLRGADLGGANLHSADLREVELQGLDLSEVELGQANLRGANLRDAQLREAKLRGADLRKANLCGVSLHPKEAAVAQVRGSVGTALPFRVDGARVTLPGELALRLLLSGESMATVQWEESSADPKALQRFLDPLLSALYEDGSLMDLAFNHRDHDGRSVLASLHSMDARHASTKAALMQQLCGFLTVCEDDVLAPLAGPLLDILTLDPRYLRHKPQHLPKELPYYRFRAPGDVLSDVGPPDWRPKLPERLAALAAPGTLSERFFTGRVTSVQQLRELVRAGRYLGAADLTPGLRAFGRMLVFKRKDDVLLAVKAGTNLRECV